MKSSKPYFDKNTGIVEFLPKPEEKVINVIACDKDEIQHEVRVGYSVGEHWLDKQKIIQVFDVKKDLTVDYVDLIYDIKESIKEEEGRSIEIVF